MEWRKADNTQPLYELYKGVLGVTQNIDEWDTSAGVVFKDQSRDAQSKFMYIVSLHYLFV
jgi:hypothetical protein